MTLVVVCRATVEQQVCAAMVALHHQALACPSRVKQDLRRAQIAFPASIQRLSVRQQIRRALGVRLIQTRRQAAQPWQLASATQDRRGKTEERAQDAFLESTREQLATQHAQTV